MKFARSSVCVGVFGVLCAAASVSFVPNALNWLRGWPSYAYNAQHAAKSPFATQPLVGIHWQTPVDLMPPPSGIHYGAPLVTLNNNVLVTLKTQTNGSFQIDCRRGSN